MDISDLESIIIGDLTGDSKTAMENIIAGSEASQLVSNILMLAVKSTANIQEVEHARRKFLEDDEYDVNDHLSDVVSTLRKLFK